MNVFPHRGRRLTGSARVDAGNRSLHTFRLRTGAWSAAPHTAEPALADVTSFAAVSA